MLEGDVQLVQHDQADGLVAEQPLGHSPGFLRLGDITLTILGFPGKAFAHDVVADLFGKTPEEGFLTGAGSALDELHHADPEAMTEGPRDHAEGTAALALAITAVHQQQAVFVLSLGDLLVDQGFLALHARLVTGIAFAGLVHAVLLYIRHPRLLLVKQHERR